MSTETTSLKKFDPKSVEVILSKVNTMKDVGGINLPPDYSPENALRSALLKLQEPDKNGVTLLDKASHHSVSQALFNMVVQGLNPAKNQCSFIPYGDKIIMQREYAGSIALARRFSAMKDIFASIIYQDDVFEYELDTTTGMKKIKNHSQRLENIDDTKIKGAYAVVTFADGSFNTEIMTIAQIQQSWKMGSTQGNSPAHRNFPGEMAKKPVINRACKLLIAASDDSVLMEPVDFSRASKSKAIIESEANQGDYLENPDELEEASILDISDPEPVNSSKKPEFKREWKHEKPDF
ncbi:MAG: recombinase RecT [Bacteroidetes bacterium]|nr:recombinase RecT [Bacteroidota bacterium]